MEEKILEFIKRRFPEDQHWTNGNCFFFALILEHVFGGSIVYNVVAGHFMLQIDGCLYDWTGKVDEHGPIVEWDKFAEYDVSQMARIIRDCIR